MSAKPIHAREWDEQSIELYKLKLRYAATKRLVEERRAQLAKDEQDLAERWGKDEICPPGRGMLP